MLLGRGRCTELASYPPGARLTRNGTCGTISQISVTFDFRAFHDLHQHPNPLAGARLRFDTERALVGAAAACVKDGRVGPRPEVARATASGRGGTVGSLRMHAARKSLTEAFCSAVPRAVDPLGHQDSSLD